MFLGKSSENEFFVAGILKHKKPKENIVMFSANKLKYSDDKLVSFKSVHPLLDYELLSQNIQKGGN